MKKLISLVLLFAVLAFFACKEKGYRDAFIQYEPVCLTDAEKETLRQSLESTHEKYDANEKLLTAKLNGWNYHTDALTGTYHQVRGSFNYAVGLLDLGDPQYEQRAFDILGRLTQLQDTVESSPTCGVWPYYLEEPLATKKSPVDYNWADFNAVSILDVLMGHQSRIPKQLKVRLDRALLLAARAVVKRNVDPGYTNIAIMGNYVTYMTAYLLNVDDLKEYANKRLNNYYDYTLKKGGFTEYNSPTYTITALDELERMQRHIVANDARPKIDSLYSIGWDMIAKHYHKPTAQWAGPHSRSYSTLVRPSFYWILKDASNGQIDVGIDAKRSGDVKIKHKIPAYLMPYFLRPEYPRTENNIFEPREPKITGVTYMTNDYVISTANRSSLWNQRRPMLVYWGTPQKPYYLQVRFLHDFYDFSSASFFSQQDNNNVLAGINLITNGGDKHIILDILKDAMFKASDLRIRFEIGNNTGAAGLNIPKSVNDQFSFTIDNLQFNLQMYYAAFDQYKGYWEKGGDDKNSWIDFVIYTGPEIEIDLTKIKNAAWGFALTAGTPAETTAMEKVDCRATYPQFSARWRGLAIDLPVKPDKSPGNLSHLD